MKTCACFILQFSCLKLFGIRHQFFSIFAFDPFCFFVLSCQRGERQEGVISLKSTNLKAAYSWVVAKSPNNVIVKLHKEKCVEVCSTYLKVILERIFALRWVICFVRQKNIGHDHLNSNFGPDDWESNSCFIKHINSYSARPQLQNWLAAQPREKDKREMSPLIPPNPVSPQLFKWTLPRQYYWHGTKRHPPGQLEGRISLSQGWLSVGPGGTPSVLSCYFVPTPTRRRG